MGYVYLFYWIDPPPPEIFVYDVPLPLYPSPDEVQ